MLEVVGFCYKEQSFKVSRSLEEGKRNDDQGVQRIRSVQSYSEKKALSTFQQSAVGNCKSIISSKSGTSLTDRESLRVLSSRP